MKLCNATLADLPDGILRPTYDRAALRPGIVHIGLGNFHRAHQAWYTHRLMQAGQGLDWGIMGAGVRPYDAAMRDKLIAQDCLTTLIELDPGQTRAEVTGAMVGYVPITAGNGPLIARMAAPDTRIVSLTVTESGYFRVGGDFDASHPDIVHDAAHPGTPRTVFGAMVAALAQRRAAGISAFTGLSCDNLQGNGTILRDTVIRLARLSDPALADWIAARVRFPNSMVDCIVPATGPDELALAAQMGIDDAAPVTHEAFRQWVIEDDFVDGRPDWDRVGATFSADVHAYETMKIRILNGGHQVIANAAELLSVPTIADGMADPMIRGLLDRVSRTEIAPHVAPVPQMTPLAYVSVVAGRFANPRIKDTTRRVAFDGSARHPGFVLPSVRAGVAAGAPIDGLALVEALWARMCAGHREDGSPIAPNDPHWDSLTARATAAQHTPDRWLTDGPYGDLAQSQRFARAFSHWLAVVWQHGTQAAITRYLAS